MYSYIFSVKKFNTVFNNEYDSYVTEYTFDKFINYFDIYNKMLMSAYTTSNYQFILYNLKSNIRSDINDEIYFILNKKHRMTNTYTSYITINYTNSYIPEELDRKTKAKAFNNYINDLYKENKIIKIKNIRK